MWGAVNPISSRCAMIGWVLGLSGRSAAAVSPGGLSGSGGGDRDRPYPRTSTNLCLCETLCPSELEVNPRLVLLDLLNGKRRVNNKNTSYWATVLSSVLQKINQYLIILSNLRWSNCNQNHQSPNKPNNFCKVNNMQAKAVNLMLCKVVGITLIRTSTDIN